MRKSIPSGIAVAFAMWLAVLLVPLAGHAQGGIQQSGPVTAGHVPTWFANGILGDAGPASNGTITNLGLLGTGLPSCINDAPISSPTGYHQLCFGANSNNQGTISYQNYGGATALPFVFQINGASYPFSLATGGISVISNIAALRANTAVLGQVFVQGYTTNGDGGEGPFWLNSADTTSADNGGTIIVDAAGHRWYRQTGNGPISPMQFGCKGNGTTDDTACVQATFAAANKGAVALGPHVYAINSSGVTCSAPMALSGTQGNQPISPSYGTFSGFRALSVNSTPLTLAGGCTGSILQNFSIDMATAGTNTSGSAIYLATPANITLQNIAINGPCIGIDDNGNTINLNYIQITNLAGSGCGGIRVGHATTGAATITNITNTSINSSTGNPADYGLRIEDAGGIYTALDSFILTKVGTVILPSTNQQVDYATLGHNYNGDTNTQYAMTIDTAATSAVVKGITIEDGWLATAGIEGLMAKNTGGGTVSGIHLVGTRVFNNTVNGVDIYSGVMNFTSDAGIYCGNGLPTGGDIVMESGASNFAIRSTNSSNASCDGFSPSQYNLILAGSNANGIITDNNWSNLVTPVLGVPTGNSVVANNVGLDTQIPTTASAATLNFNSINPLWALTGTTGVTSIAASWAGRSLTMIPQTGSISFTQSSTICNSLTATQYEQVLARFISPCWFLK